MKKDEINDIVNKYLQFEEWCVRNGVDPDSDLDKYDEQYKIWLEKMEKDSQ
jgi:hypothetical protein